ncbi:acyl carrier protein [Kitasatospora sp. NBC_01266]|uniref:acyl carrier protein n=1 Tax=Kitasatospora sp. NBC_01266 TaxID=2903572 RepID=UPI002E34FBF1|nr:acyl carrier protein [Kitasatospora sp. NBC_01266]
MTTHASIAADHVTTDSAAPADQDELIRRETTRFLQRYIDEAELRSGDRLITGGLLDSLATVALVAFVERQFAVTVLDEDLDLTNFDSITAIAGFVRRKQDR